MVPKFCFPVGLIQKPGLTELIDRDGDGTVDQYRTVASGWGLSTGCHEYSFGLGVDPNQNLWFADNQGDWIQACKLAATTQGRFYGHPETTEDALPEKQSPDGHSAVWFPYEHCKSVSGLV